jgi:hypothetical protein
MKNIQILAEVHKQLKLFGAEHEMSIREIVEEAVGIYMANKSKEGNEFPSHLK